MWCSRSRKLHDRLKRLKEPIREKVKQLDCEFIGLETMPANVLYLTGRTRQWPQRNRPGTEGFASKILRQCFRHFARLRGIPIVFVEPRNTSKECSRCGSEGARIGKKFVCQCGHVDHADANAGFNIAMRPSIGQSIADRDAKEGHADIPRGATL